MSLHECKEPGCTRAFLDVAALTDHAEAVHTFNDIRDSVNDAVRAKYRKPADPTALPAEPSVWVWVADIADDWVVFELNSAGNSSLQKASYTIDDSGAVTLGTPVEVRRKTVYEPVKKVED